MVQPVPQSPPHNAEAEAAVLGAFLLDPKFASQQVNGLKPEHFYLRKHMLIYRAMRGVLQRGEPLDYLTLSAALGNDLGPVGGTAYIMQMLNAMPSAVNVHHYAQIVQDMWRRREILRLAGDVARLAYDEHSDTNGSAEIIQQQLAGLLRKPDREINYLDLGSFAATLPPIEWLWPSWIPRGFISLLGAVPGAGKSLVALDLAKRIIQGENWPDGTRNTAPTNRVIYVDAELVPQLQHARAKSWGMDESQLFLMLPRPNDMIDFGSQEYRDQLRSMIENIQPSLVVLDSLSSITSRGENNVEDIRSIMGFFNEMASNYQIGLLLIHHLRKQGSQQMRLPLNTGRISIDDFRGSGHIIAMSRSVLALSTVRTSADNDDRNGPRKLEIVKTNLGAYPDPLGCELMPLHPRGVFLKWSTEAPKPYKEPTKADLVRAWLQEILHEPLSPKDVIERGAEEGWSRATIYRAKREMGTLIANTEGHQSPHNKWVLASVANDL